MALKFDEIKLIANIVLSFVVDPRFYCERGFEKQPLTDIVLFQKKDCLCCAG